MNIKEAIRLEKLVNKVKNISVMTERDNANVGNNFSAKLLQTASETNKTINLMELPEEFALAHENGLFHEHDLDSYTITSNCLSMDVAETLAKGFNTGYGTINKPKTVGTAAELACILLQSTQNDLFGGQALADFDDAMADYVEATEVEIREQVVEALELAGQIHEWPTNKIEELVRKRLIKAVHQAMQGVVYNLNTMHSRAGKLIAL